MKLDLTTPRLWNKAYAQAQIRLAHSLPDPVLPMTDVELALRKALDAEPLERLAERVAGRLRLLAV